MTESGNTGSVGVSDLFGADKTDGGPPDDTLELKVMNVEYTESGGQTTIHVFGRDSGRNQHHVEVVGHLPSFLIHEDEHNRRVDNHYAVAKTEKYDPSTGERYESLHGEPLVRVYTHTPTEVGNIRELFDTTWEADVFYTTRFLIDQGIMTGCRVDTTDAITDEPWLTGDMRVNVDAVSALDVDDTPSVEPRQAVIDIEVAGLGSVPDTDEAAYPVSTVVGYDTYAGEYVGWILESDEWDREAMDAVWDAEADPSSVEGLELDDLRVFAHEDDMLADFHAWMADVRPDIITGWYSNDFDIPYLINRSRNLTTFGYQDWSPLGETYTSKYEPVVKGASCIDMLEAYKKTQKHNLKRKGLDDVAEAELGQQKVDFDVDGDRPEHTEMWHQRPVEFLRYNQVDVRLVRDLDEEKGLIDLLDKLRAVTGVSYSDPIGGNIDMMDTLFLRKAREYGLALPTAVSPEVGYYHGAYVYTPTAGIHENVVYPDYSSLYPNMMYQCNISPETLVGTESDLAASEYTEDDCVWSYIDTETPPSDKDDVEANEDRMERVYFLKPGVKEGFIRSVLDDIMGLADEYTGKMYEAVKRVRNSSYGVLGDSDSYGTGFRLFDWRLAEATTLGGQKVLKDGAQKFVDASPDPDAEVIYGDTDSVVTKLPNAEDGEHALQMAEHATEATNEWLDGYAAETFGLDGPSDARMDLELESYARGIFFKGQDDGESRDGLKKRYAQMVEWDEDEGWISDPTIDIKGFEYVRSDVADVTAQVQYKTFEMLFARASCEAHADYDSTCESCQDAESDTEERVKEYVSNKISGIIDGSVPLDDFGIPFGIGQPLHEYGEPDRSAQAQYAGAKYANAHIYGEEAITPGSDAMYYYIVEGKTGSGRRSTYSANTGEGGRYVHCVSVLEGDDMPDGVEVDRPKMVEKTIIDPMAAIFETLGWNAEWLEKECERATPPEYYRDDEQTGLGDLV